MRSASIIPLLGPLSGEFSSNYAIGVDFTVRWVL
jgi:hypothetical protein